MSLFMLLIETLEILDKIEEPSISDNALNGNSLNLGNLFFPVLFSKRSNAASPVFWEPLFSVPKSKLLFSVGFLLSYRNDSVCSYEQVGL